MLTDHGGSDLDEGEELNMKVVGATVNITLEQPADSCSSNETQYLDVTFKDAGGGCYLVIETKEWAIDSADDLVKVLNELHRKAADLNGTPLSACNLCGKDLNGESGNHQACEDEEAALKENEK